MRTVLRSQLFKWLFRQATAKEKTRNLIPKSIQIEICYQKSQKFQQLVVLYTATSLSQILCFNTATITVSFIYLFIQSLASRLFGINFATVVSLASISPALGGTSTAGEQLKNPCGCTPITKSSYYLGYTLTQIKLHFTKINFHLPNNIYKCYFYDAPILPFVKKSSSKTLDRKHLERTKGIKRKNTCNKSPQVREQVNNPYSI